MADGLLDLGGGVKMVNPSALIPGGGGSDALSLLKLSTDLQMLPLQAKKLQIDTALKENELMNIEVENLAKRVSLGASAADQQRTQIKFLLEGYKQVYELFKLDPGLGNVALSQLNPDAQASMNEDGTVSIHLPSQKSGSTASMEEKITINIDPNKLDPEKRATLEGQWFDRFHKPSGAIVSYNEISRNFKTLEASSKLATGAGDLAVVFAFMKMLDPTSTVREGEAANAKNTPNVPDTIRNMWNRALASDAPLFGAKDSTARKNFVGAATAVAKEARNSALLFGKDIADYAKRERLNPKNVVSPVGDISEDEFILSPEEIVKQLTDAVNGKTSP